MYYILFTSKTSSLFFSPHPSVDAGLFRLDNRNDIPAMLTQANEIPTKNSVEKYILQFEKLL